MAHFFGTVTGRAKVDATRCGTRNSGLETVAASLGGCIHVRLSHRDGEDYATVTMEPWEGNGTTATLYQGPMSSFDPSNLGGTNND